MIASLIPKRPKPQRNRQGRAVKIIRGKSGQAVQAAHHPVTARKRQAEPVQQVHLGANLRRHHKDAVGNVVFKIVAARAPQRRRTPAEFQGGVNVQHLVRRVGIAQPKAPGAQGHVVIAIVVAPAAKGFALAVAADEKIVDDKGATATCAAARIAVGRAEYEKRATKAAFDTGTVGQGFFALGKCERGYPHDCCKK